MFLSQEKDLHFNVTLPIFNKLRMSNNRISSDSWSVHIHIFLALVLEEPCPWAVERRCTLTSEHHKSFPVQAIIKNHITPDT